MTFFREPDVRLQGFLHDPAAGTIRAIGKAVDALGQFGWNMCRHHSLGHDQSTLIKLINLIVRAGAGTQPPA